MSASVLKVIPLAQIVESKHNNRKRFDASDLQELARSLNTHGQLQPVLVRPMPETTPGVQKYELASGHRRLRAAKLAGMPELEAKVRDMADLEFIEILTIDNLQRVNLHPLEEAADFKALLTTGSYDYETIAKKIGREAGYVKDRLRLLRLTNEAQQLFLADKFTIAHAVELAKLAPADQERAIALDVESLYVRTDHGLFVADHGLFDEDDDMGVDVLDRVKCVSVTEFKRWISEHIRIDTASPVVADLFPQTAQLVHEAATAKQKVVAITRLYRVADDAKDPLGGRTYGVDTWTRADGMIGSKGCTFAVLGVVAAGPGQGEAFDVCIAKDRCETHWGAEIKAKRKDAELRAKAAGGDVRAGAKVKVDEAALAKKAAQEKAAEEYRAKAVPMIVAAVPAAVAKLSEKKAVELFRACIDDDAWGVGNIITRRIKKLPTSALALLTFVIGECLIADTDNSFKNPRVFDQLVEHAARAGVNTAAIEKACGKSEPVKAPTKTKKKAA
jgi:ParB/RepB/Spo0J family partition protein